MNTKGCLLDRNRPTPAARLGRMLVLLGALVAAGCGGVDPAQQISSAPVAAHRAALELATASAELAEQDLPDCKDAGAASGTVALLRHPESDDLVIVVVNGKAECVDSEEGALVYIGSQPNLQPTSGIFDSSQSNGESGSEEGGEAGRRDRRRSERRTDPHQAGQRKRRGRADPHQGETVQVPR